MSHLRSKTCHAIARIRRGRATVAARGRPRWSTRGVRQPGTWPGERERGVRERAAGQSSPAPAPVAAGRSSLARTGGRAELAFACTCGGRGAAALHAHPWRLGRSSPGARSRRPGGLRAELACAHGGRGGAPRHTRSRLPGRARLRPSPRRPARAPPRAPAAKPSSPVRARSLAVLLDVRDPTSTTPGISSGGLHATVWATPIPFRLLHCTSIWGCWQCLQQLLPCSPAAS